MRKSIVALILSLSLLFSFQSLEAQQNRVNYNNGNGSPHNQPSNAPIDGGLGILLAAGVVFGIKKVRDRQADAKTEAGK